MRYMRLAILCVILLVIFQQSGARKKRTLKRSKRNHVTCRPRTLVRYRLAVHTMWSRQKFPKMYPTYRPHAQWSALVGRTHSPDYKMWEEGENATYGVKVFAETGDQSFLDTESVQGYDSILDTFVGPPIGRGVGETSTVIVLDGGHSVLSFMMRIIPSPDWFVGLNGLDLCARGRWKKEVQVDLEPMDAGTDQGLTFSAPNWPNEPIMPISAITSRFPDHPASSFYYPDLKKLPRLAYVKLDLVAEYRQRRTFMGLRPHYNTTVTPPVGESGTNTEKSTGESVTNNKADKQSELQSMSNAHEASPSVNADMPATSLNSDSFSTSEASTKQLPVTKKDIQVDEQDKETQIPVADTQSFLSETPQNDAVTYDRFATNDRFQSPTDRDYKNKQSHPGKSGQNSQIAKTAVGDTSVEEDQTEKPIPIFKLRELKPGSAKTKINREIATSEPTKNISPRTFEEPQFMEVSTRFMDREHEYAAIDCEVAEWSEWSPCTETCGFGKKERSRDVLKLPNNGGANCPRLRQEALCGSMRSCKWGHFDHFSLLSPGKKTREGRSRRRRFR